MNIAITKLPKVDKVRELIEDMKDEQITRDAVAKLQTMIPDQEEIEQIKQSQKETPDLPLGTAEKYLLGENKV